jgi:hypothetical protein
MRPFNWPVLCIGADTENRALQMIALKRKNSMKGTWKRVDPFQVQQRDQGATKVQRTEDSLLTTIGLFHR